MADIAVYIECDAAGCRARTREIWVKDGMPLTFCGHHLARNVIALQAQGFHPLEQEALTR